MDAQTVHNFWFKELVPEQWFIKSHSLDQTLIERFGAVHKAAAKGDLTHWRETIQGRLSEIIVLDQFSRNMFRDSAKAFAQDALALELAKAAVVTGQDRNLTIPERAFLYMPFMHSENLKDHEQAVELFGQPGLETQLAFELRHKKIIEKFGRYPHRNNFLGRASTAEEFEFLKLPGSSF
jgi:uncharacterized protein (DUF924 family)